MGRENLIASWPPIWGERTYSDYNGKVIATGEDESKELKGSELPAHAFVQNQAKNLQPKNFQSTKLFINLPEPFFQAFLTQQMINPFSFPTIGTNKNVTVREVMELHTAFTSEDGTFHPDNWSKLGWASREAYDKWLDTLVLFAFSHCNHYCSTIRIFDGKKSDDGVFEFKQQSPDQIKNSPKTTNIFSVTGFEYRGFAASDTVSIETTVKPAGKSDVFKHSKLTMEQILAAAVETDSTDIVMIPFGTGVFIKGRKAEPVIKKEIMDGLVAGLKEYKGRPVTIHCCGWSHFYTDLASSKNPLIHFVDSTNNDAYTVNNEIQDRGDEENQLEDLSQYPNLKLKPRKLKSMLINAGDNDWTALLDPTKGPGQYYLGHHLYRQTSDEYYALMTNFILHSIQRLKEVFGNLFTAGKIKQLTELENSGVRLEIKATSEIPSGTAKNAPFFSPPKPQSSDWDFNHPTMNMILASVLFPPAWFYLLYLLIRLIANSACFTANNEEEQPIVSNMV